MLYAVLIACIKHIWLTLDLEITYYTYCNDNFLPSRRGPIAHGKFLLLSVEHRRADDGRSYIKV